MRCTLLALVVLAGPAWAAPDAENPVSEPAPAAPVEAPAPAPVETPTPGEPTPAAADDADPPASAPPEDTDMVGVEAEVGAEGPDAEPEPPAAPVEDTDPPGDADAKPTLWRGWDWFVGPPAPVEGDTPAAMHEHPVEAGSDHVDHAQPSGQPSPPSSIDRQPLPSAPPPAPLPRDLPFLPSLPLRGWKVAVLLAIATLLSWGAARGLAPVRDWLAPAGVLPTLASAMQQVFRALALFFVFGVIAAIIPENLEPALPWIVLAGALAIGWSIRDVTPDLIAGVVLSAERRVRPGQWIGTEAASGVVDQVTLRVTWIRDATGRRVAVPNRMFLRGAVITDRGQWPSLEVVLRIPGDHPPSTVRRVVQDAVMVSPWSAPLPPELVREEQEADLWRVRARVLEGRFADRFEGALREHVEEVLKTGTGLREAVRRRGTHEPEESV